jgi:diguanylate cyclase (GGDEF)-like protein
MRRNLTQRAIVVALILAAAVGALAAHLVTTHQLDQSRDRKVATALNEVGDAVHSRTFYLEDVADMVGVHDDADQAEFSRYAHVRSRNDPAVVAVQWLRRSPTGKLVPPRDVGADLMLVAPTSRENAVAANAAAAPVAAPAIHSAEAEKLVGISAPVTLANGHRGFYLAVPVEARLFSGDVSKTESRSAIVGLIDAQELVAGAISDGGPDVRLNDEASLLAAVGSDPDNDASAAVPVPDRAWTVAVEGGSLSVFERALPWLIVAFGLGLALGVALILGHSARRRDAAMELAGDRSAELADSLERVEKANEDLEVARAEAERRSRVDALLGIFNRRHFSEVLGQELGVNGSGVGPAVLLLDLDNFKRINDMHGHLTGDAALQVASERISSSLRQGDCLARWGGEEFAVLAPAIDREGLSHLAERARKAVAADSMEVDGATIELTLSVGGALAADGLATPDALLGAADQALYDAKRAGRNCVRIWDTTAGVEPAGAPS